MVSVCRMEEDEIRRLQHERRVKTGELAAFGRAGNDEEQDRSAYASSIDVGGGGGGEESFQPASGLASFTGETPGGASW